MTYVDFSAGGKDYKLRLNTLTVVKLEKKIGKNPLKVFADAKNSGMVSTEDLIEIFYYSLIALQSDITYEKACAIFDEWIADGHIIAEFVSIVVEIYQQAGLIRKN